MTTAPDGRPTMPRRPDLATYWARQMEAGLAFVERVLAHPVEDDGEPLVDLEREAQRNGVVLSCSQQPHAQGRRRLFLAREGMVPHLLAAAAEFQDGGHTLLIEDAFRTREMQRDLAVIDQVLDQLLRIEPGADAQTMCERLSVVVAARPRGAGHMAGAAVDVSLLGPDQRPLDRGGPYVTVSEKMPMDSPFVSDEAIHNRRLVSDVMRRHGFAPYPFEFWHFSRDDAFARVADGDPRPARYGPLDLRDDGSAVPAARQLDPLNPPELLTRRLELLMRGSRRS